MYKKVCRTSATWKSYRPQICKTLALETTTSACSRALVIANRLSLAASERKISAENVDVYFMSEMMEYTLRVCSARSFPVLVTSAETFG